eukprot:COSAG05_NODE_2258_length_3325_cov_4.958153_2_plen_109_part_00
MAKLSKGQKQRVIKKAENGWSKAGDNKDTPCSVCVKKLKDDDIQCDKLVLKNGKSMRWVDGPRGHKVYKFESTVNAVASLLRKRGSSLWLAGWPAGWLAVSAVTKCYT